MIAAIPPTAPEGVPAHLQRRFLSRARDRLAEMRSIVVGTEGDRLTAGDRDILIRLAHQLAGSGGSYGLRDLSRSAWSLEHMLENGWQTKAEIERRLGDIERLLATPA